MLVSDVNALYRRAAKDAAEDEANTPSAVIAYESEPSCDTSMMWRIADIEDATMPNKVEKSAYHALAVFIVSSSA